jgi:very-short-patch-repair endonuclease
MVWKKGEHASLETEFKEGDIPWSRGLTKQHNKILAEMSKKFSGCGNPMYGMCGKLNPFYSKKHTQKTKEIMSEHRKGKGQQFGDANPSKRLDVRQKISKTRIEKQISQTFWADKKWKERQIMLIQKGWTLEKRQKARDRLLKRFELGLQKHPNYIVGDKKTMRKSTEIPIFLILTKLKFQIDKDYFFQYKVRESSFWLDFAFPSIKIGIEGDGVYWHADEYDKRKDIILQSLGWKILRFNEKQLKDTNLITNVLSKVLEEVR